MDVGLGERVVQGGEGTLDRCKKEVLAVEAVSCESSSS